MGEDKCVCHNKLPGHVCDVSDAASKHAVQGFFDSLRAEVGDHGIGVSVISPSYIRTNLSTCALTADGGTYGSTHSTS